MFRFKQFTIRQERSPMKVGTDGVLLGAWVRVSSSVCRILDIGTGTGVIALMLAQRTQERSGVRITALDIGEVAEARANADASPWGARVETPTVPRFPASGCAGACLGSASTPAGCAPGDGCAAVLTGTEAIPCFHHTVSSRSRCMTGSCCTSCLPLLRHIFLHIALWSSGIAHLVLYCS